MQTQLREIFSFLRNPEAFLTQKSRFPPGKGLLYALANTLMIYMIFIAVLIIVSLTIKAGTGFDLLALFTEGKIKVRDVERGYFFALVYAPVVEEILFRSYLRLTPVGIWLSVSFLSMLVFPVLLRFVPDDPALYLLFPYLLCYVLLALVLAKVLRRPTDIVIAKYLRPHYKWLVYASIFGFGFMHLSNYEELTTWHVALAPILVFTQLVGGVFMSFVRVNYGLVYAMILHALGNLYVVLIGLLAKDHAYYNLPVIIIVSYSIYKLWKYSKEPRLGGLVE